MSAASRLRLALLMAATALAQACAPVGQSPSAPRALQVCADKAGRRVDNRLCQGAAEDNPYLWYYFDAAASAPPLGSPLTGGSLIATAGVAYGAAAAGDSPSASDASQTFAETASSPLAETVVTRDPSGAFVVHGEVNGHPVTFVVDTGASEVVLSPEDGQSLGLDPDNLKYDRVYQTANGIGRGASFQASEIRVGSIRIADVPASVNQAPMRYSLLGRAFLDRLNAFRVERGRLYLR